MKINNFFILIQRRRRNLTAPPHKFLRLLKVIIDINSHMNKIWNIVCYLLHIWKYVIKNSILFRSSKCRTRKILVGSTPSLLSSPQRTTYGKKRIKSTFIRISRFLTQKRMNTLFMSTHSLWSRFPPN